MLMCIDQFVQIIMLLYACQDVNWAEALKHPRPVVQSLKGEICFAVFIVWLFYKAYHTCITPLSTGTKLC